MDAETPPGREDHERDDEEGDEKTPDLVMLTFPGAEMEDVEVCGRECCQATQKAIGTSLGAMGTAAPDKKMVVPMAAQKVVEASPAAASPVAALRVAKTSAHCEELLERGDPCGPEGS